MSATSAPAHLLHVYPRSRHTGRLEYISRCRPVIPRSSCPRRHHHPHPEAQPSHRECLALRPTTPPHPARALPTRSSTNSGSSGSTRAAASKRPLVAPPVAPGLDAATGVESRDVQLASYSVRLYLPSAAATAPGAKLPVVVYVHGGGFVAESAASLGCHRFLNTLTAACPALSVSVEYRLAPEHPLPAAYDDSLAALKWTLSAADPWIAAHGDLDRVFLAGDSAGANICHYLAVHPDIVNAQTHQGQGGGGARARRRLKGAVLIHPWFWGSEAVGGEPRHPAVRAMGARLWLFACPGANSMDDPRMNPMAPGAPGLDTMACERAMVCAAEHDFLRWRGRAYAEAVAAARGVEGEGSVELLETEGEGHVFYVAKPDGDKAKAMLDRIVSFVNAP